MSTFVFFCWLDPSFLSPGEFFFGLSKFGRGETKSREAMKSFFLFWFLGVPFRFVLVETKFGPRDTRSFCEAEARRFGLLCPGKGGEGEGDSTGM